MGTQTFDTVIVRFGGEIGIKAPMTRKQYERRLTRNIKTVLKHYAISSSAVIKKPGRLYIKTSQPDQTVQKLSQVFGISSLSAAVETTSKLNDILSLSAQLASLKFKPHRSFAVRCHRVGNHPYTSQEICARIGDHILSSLSKLKLHVNLSKPEQTLHLEVREEKAYVFTQIIKAAGGLPLGTQPKLVCLLKDDIQSTVACWLTMKRGSPPVLVHFTGTNHAQAKSTSRAGTLAQQLMKWNIGFPRKLRVTQYGSFSRKVSRLSQNELTGLLHKRFMLQVAQHIAEATKAEGIVTGDSLQKNTAQTLHAFRIQDEAIKGYPIYRPIAGLDPADMEETAAKIGFEKTKPKPIRTKAEEKQPKRAEIRLKDVVRTEKKLKIEKMVNEALATLQVLEI